jgi:hypothetical protein
MFHWRSVVFGSWELYEKINYFPSASNKATKTKHKAPKKDNTLKNSKHFLSFLRYQTKANKDRTISTWIAQKWNWEIMVYVVTI